MRKFVIVLKYELKEYFSNKAFMGLTVLLALLGVGMLFLPRFVDMSGFTGVKIVGGEDSSEKETPEGEKPLFLYADHAGVVQEDVLAQLFPDAVWQKAEPDAIKASVEAQEAEAGFVVTGKTEYEYYVFNKPMQDNNMLLFQEAMRQFYRMDYCRQNGWNLEEVAAMYDVPITVEEEVLNKDSGR